MGGILKILKKVESRKINPKEDERKKLNDEDESSKKKNVTNS